MIQRDVWLVVEGWKGEHEGDYVSDCVCVCVWHEFRICQNQNGFIFILSRWNYPGTLDCQAAVGLSIVTAESPSVPRGVESKEV